MFSKTSIDLSTALLDACRARALKLATAESCTGGLIAGCLTEIAGSSDVFDRGFATYSNGAKTEILNVPADVIAAEGAVSEPVARAMAEGALANSDADVVVAVTGIAGPGGGGPGKPVGLVHFATSKKGASTEAFHTVFEGNRTGVRSATVEKALELMLRRVEQAG